MSNGFEAVADLWRAEGVSEREIRRRYLELLMKNVQRAIEEFARALEWVAGKDGEAHG